MKSFIEEAAKSPKLVIIGRSENCPCFRRVSIPNRSETCNLADVLEKLEVDIERLKEIFKENIEKIRQEYGSADVSEYQKLGCINIRDVWSWSRLSQLLGKNIEILSQDPQFPGPTYPVAIFYPNGKYRITTTTVGLRERLKNLVRKFSAKEGDLLDYPAYVGQA